MEEAELPHSEKSIDAIQKVLIDWKKSPYLCSLGATGIMAKVKAKEDVSRRDVCTNIAVLKPIVTHLGA